jgi:hypothetical protein
MSYGTSSPKAIARSAIYEHSQGRQACRPAGASADQVQFVDNLKTPGAGRQISRFGQGGERAAVIYTLIESAKLNGLDPEAYLAGSSTVWRTFINRLDELLFWNWRREPVKLAA